MRWRWLVLVAVTACRIDLDTRSAHLVPLVETGPVPTYLRVDSQGHLWETVPNGILRVLEKSTWSTDGSWSGSNVSAIGAQLTSGVLVTTSSGCARVTLNPPQIEAITAPPPPFSLFWVGQLADGEILGSQSVGPIVTLDSHTNTWVQTGLDTAHVPMITPTHELVGFARTGELIRLSDTTSAATVLLPTIDPNLRAAGVDPNGDVIVYDKANVHAVSGGSLKHITVDSRDDIQDVVATSRHIYASVQRLDPPDPPLDLLVELTDDGPSVIDQGESPHKSAGLLALPSGDAYVIDGGYVGRIEY